MSDNPDANESTGKIKSAQVAIGYQKPGPRSKKKVLMVDQNVSVIQELNQSNPDKSESETSAVISNHEKSDENHADNSSMSQKR
jgi:hypothetical protein